MVNWLDISAGEMRDAGLRVLIDDDLKRQHAAERQQASRRNAGVHLRSEWIAAHTIERDRPWELEGAVAQLGIGFGRGCSARGRNEMRQVRHGVWWRSLTA
jgi:hypothetical protein